MDCRAQFGKRTFEGGFQRGARLEAARVAVGQDEGLEARARDALERLDAVGPAARGRGALALARHSPT